MQIYWNYLDSKYWQMSPFDRLKTMTSMNNKGEDILPIIMPMSESGRYYTISIACSYGWNLSEHTITKLKDAFALLAKGLSFDEINDIMEDQRSKGNIQKIFEVKKDRFQLFVPHKLLESSREIIEKVLSNDQCLVPDLNSD
jgi:hypothetical protein